MRVACLLRARGAEVKVSLRGKGDVDVQKIAARFGGGGHPNAAGFTVPGDLAQVTRDVLAAVREAAGAEPRAPETGHPRSDPASRHPLQKPDPASRPPLP